MTATEAPPKVKHTTAAEFSRATRTANEDLKNEVSSIRTMLSALNEKNIRERKQIGNKIIAIRDNKDGRYGQNPMKEVEALMPLSRDGIRPIIKFAETYEDTDVDTLVSFKHPVTGEGVTWSHIIALTRVPDKDRAIKMAEQAVTKGWSTRELVAEVTRSAGGRRSKGGRKPKLAGNITACLHDVAAKSAGMENAIKQWVGSGGLSDMLAAEERMTQPLLMDLERVLSSVDSMLIQVHALSAELRTLHTQVQAALAPKTIVT